MEIMNDYSFEGLMDACWSGAEDTLKDIEKAGFEDEFMSYLEDTFCDETPTMTQVNDFIRFDCSDWLTDRLGEQSPDDIDDILSYVAEQFDTIEEFYDAIDDYDTLPIL